MAKSWPARLFRRRDVNPPCSQRGRQSDYGHFQHPDITLSVAAWRGSWSPLDLYTLHLVNKSLHGLLFSPLYRLLGQTPRWVDPGTPWLHEAVRRRWLLFAERLLDHGYDISAVDDEKEETALHLVTALKRDRDFLRLLIDRGADLEATDVHGHTPLHSALRGLADLEFLRELLDRGASIDVRDHFGQTALLLAVTCGQSLQILRLLIDRGADPNARDNHGRAPVHYIVLFNRALQNLHLLLDSGADRNVTDNYGRTPLDYANSFNAGPEILRILTSQP